MVVWCTSVSTATKALELGTLPSPNSPSEAPAVAEAEAVHRSPTARVPEPLPLIFWSQTIPPAPPHRPPFSPFHALVCPFTRQLIPITLKLTCLQVLPTMSTSHSTALWATSTPDGTRRLEASSPVQVQRATLSRCRSGPHQSNDLCGCLRMAGCNQHLRH